MVNWPSTHWHCVWCDSKKEVALFKIYMYSRPNSEKRCIQCMEQVATLRDEIIAKWASSCARCGVHQALLQQAPAIPPSGRGAWASTGRG